MNWFSFPFSSSVAGGLRNGCFCRRYTVSVRTGRAASRSTNFSFMPRIFAETGSDTHELDDLVIEERHAAFDRVRHLHAVAEDHEDVAREDRLAPEVERLVHRGAAREPAGHVQAVEERAVGVATGELGRKAAL